MITEERLASWPDWFKPAPGPGRPAPPPDPDAGDDYSDDDDAPT